MTTLVEAEVTAAETRARACADINRQALGAETPPLPDVEWVFGRDGALTARHSDGQWWSGCSLPRRAAQAQLKKLDVQGQVACFLAPPHASAVRVALDKLRLEQSIVAIVPDPRDLAVMLACEDFTDDVARNRLWFASGASWADQLHAIFETNEGLSIPTQFIRLNTADAEVVDGLIAAAQKVFSDATNQRAQLMRALRVLPRTNVAEGRLCVVASQSFRLWNDWGHVLESTFRDDSNVAVLNGDDPASSSPLAIARVSADCAAILTIDLARTDAPGVVSDAARWITLAASGRTPAPSERDLLVLLDDADRSTAIKAGWSTSQVHLVTRPTTVHVTISHPIAIVTDTLSLEPPTSIDDFSSHRLLWEYVRDELTRNPFAAGQDVDAYLTSRLRKFEVSEQTLSRAAFTARLILPAYAQGVARTLLDANVDIQLFGAGWNSDPRFAEQWRGPVPSRKHLSNVVAQVGTLVHVAPDRRIHPIDLVGRPVVRAFSHRTCEALLRGLRGSAPCVTIDAPVISATWLRGILSSK